MKRQRHLFQRKEEVKPQKNTSESEVSDLLEKEFKVVATKTFIKLERRMGRNIVRTSTKN